MNQKKLYILTIVILVGAVGYFAFVKKSEPVAQQPTPASTQTTIPAKIPVSSTPTPRDETANWKTYTNAKYGFSLKYPSDWKIFENNNANAQDAGLLDVSNIYYGGIEVALQDLKFTTTNDSGWTYKFGKESLGGKSLSVATGYRGNQLVERVFEVKFGSQTAVIIAQVAENYQTYSSKEKWQKLNQILSTFKLPN